MHPHLNIVIEHGQTESPAPPDEGGVFYGYFGTTSFMHPHLSVVTVPAKAEYSVSLDGGIDDGYLGHSLVEEPHHMNHRHRATVCCNVV